MALVDGLRLCCIHAPMGGGKRETPCCDCQDDYGKKCEPLCAASAIQVKP